MMPTPTVSPTTTAIPKASPTTRNKPRAGEAIAAALDMHSPLDAHSPRLSVPRALQARSMALVRDCHIGGARAGISDQRTFAFDRFKGRTWTPPTSQVLLRVTRPMGFESSDGCGSAADGASRAATRRGTLALRGIAAGDSSPIARSMLPLQSVRVRGLSVAGWLNSGGRVDRPYPRRSTRHTSYPCRGMYSIHDSPSIFKSNVEPQ